MQTNIFTSMYVCMYKKLKFNVQFMLECLPFTAAAL